MSQSRSECIGESLLFDVKVSEHCELSDFFGELLWSKERVGYSVVENLVANGRVFHDVLNSRQ